jgi:hypothetical protein
VPTVRIVAVSYVLDVLARRVDIALKRPQRPVPALGFDTGEVALPLRQMREGRMAQLVESATSAVVAEKLGGATVRQTR